jgi:hypothetical protein
MSLQQWLNNGWLKAHRTTREDRGVAGYSRPGSFRRGRQRLSGLAVRHRLQRRSETLHGARVCGRLSRRTHATPLPYPPGATPGARQASPIGRGLPRYVPRQTEHGGVRLRWWRKRERCRRPEGLCAATAGRRAGVAPVEAPGTDTAWRRSVSRRNALHSCHSGRTQSPPKGLLGHVYNNRPSRFR